MKVCTKCGVEKDESCFSKDKTVKSGLKPKCRECRNKEGLEWLSKNKEYKSNKNKEWYLKNHERELNKRRNYFYKNRENILRVNKEWQVRNSDKIKVKNKNWKTKNIEKYREYNKKWRASNRKRINTRQNDRYKGAFGELIRLKIKIRSLIGIIIRSKGYTKQAKTHDLLGCSYEHFLKHLGPKPKGDYSIDHICPCSQAKNEDELLKLQHYTNLRWLSREENISKLDKPTTEGEELCKKILGRDWIYDKSQIHPTAN